MSRIISLFLLVVSITLCTEASNVNIFGPKRYNRTTGKPNTYQDNFTLPQAATSPFILNVINGAPNGSNRVSSGTIKINGATIIKQSDFNQQVDTIRRTISLKPNNTIEVQLASAPNSYLTITITGQSGITIPVLSITQPIDGILTKTSPASVAGTVSGTAPITVTANGSLMTVETNGVVSGQVTMVEGSNTINFTATDATGGSATVVRRVILDSQPPIVNLTSPIDGLITIQSSVPVMGTVTDLPAGQAGETSIIVMINGNQINLESGGVINSTISLAEGLNTITIIAKDTVNNQTTVTRTVRRDTQSPIVNIQLPNDSTITNLQSIEISGTITDSTTVTLSVNGNAVTLGAGGNFSYQLPVAEGMNAVTLAATDAAGNEKRETIYVRRDTESPVITLTSPTDSLITNLQSIAVSGTVLDSTTVSITINGISVPVGAGGVISYRITLVEGMNTITVVATDAAGNSTTISRVAIGDWNAPILTISTPLDSLITNLHSVTLSGTVTDHHFASLKINGTIVTVNPDGSYLEEVSLTEGVNTLTLVAKDSADNVTIVTREVVGDWSAPTVIIYSPADSLKTKQTSVTINGSVSDLTKARLTVNGEMLMVNPDGTFSTTVNLAEEFNAITLVAMDAAGNVCTTSRVVILDLIPPDPITVAPVIDETVPTTMATATSFLYTGSHPIQKDVAPGTIDPLKVNVLRGKVLKRDLSPLPGVKIALLDHSEYGSTLSREDGMFDIALNGGGTVTVNYSKSGFLPVQRQVNTPMLDYMVLDSVVMIQVDPIVTLVTISDSIQVAQGSVVSDERGTRHATLMFRQGTTANMIKKTYRIDSVLDGCICRKIKTLTDSSAIPLSLMSIRATEYTVGPTGPSAMPAELPPASAYTYCVELSTDEALAAKAGEVVFNKPVSLYVENFLGFPVGVVVPIGYYDRENGVWVPSPNGLIIKIMGVVDGKAAIDENGDDIAEPQDSLLAQGFDLEELTKIAEIYPIGQSLWRSQVQHFSPYDCNWPYWILQKDVSQDQTTDGLPDANSDKPKDDKDPCKGGSIIRVHNQSLGEVVPINGTSYNLYYFSERMDGYKESNRISVPVTQNAVSPNLQWIDVQIQIAGRNIKYKYQPAQNITCNYIWDGKDAYGRTLQGEQPYTVRITYQTLIYYAVQTTSTQTPGAVFGGYSYGPQPPIIISTGSYIRGVDKVSTGTVGKNRVMPLNLGGFTLDILHSYDPTSTTMYFGNGGMRSAKYVGPKITKVDGTAGNGIQKVCLGSDGTMYFTHSFDNKVYRRCSTGSVSVLAGNGESGYSGDGGLAVNAQLNLPAGLAVSENGTVYIADQSNHVIRKVDPYGIITTVAGNGVGGYNGDDLPATQAQLSSPADIDLGPDGSIFIADAGNYRIRRIDMNGIISTIAGTGESSYSGDDGYATQATFTDPEGVAVANDGKVYVADYYDHRVRLITPDGKISTFAGNGTGGFEGDGGRAMDAQLSYPIDVAVGRDGVVYICDNGNGVIRFVRPNGSIGTFAGYYGYNEGQGGGSARQFYLGSPNGIAVGSDGFVYICVYDEVFLSTLTIISDAAFHHYICRVEPILPGVTLTEKVLPSEDGKELYVFDASGRHLVTYDALTLIPFYSFVYDATGRPVSLIDVDSLATTIEWDNNGRVKSFVSPYGQRTDMTLDSVGLISAIRNPAGETVHYTFTRDGLMTGYSDAKNNLHSFSYDSLGRLIFDLDPMGGFTQLDRLTLSRGFEITTTTAEGRRSKYRLENLPAGGVQSTTTDESGLATTTTNGEDGTAVTVTPDGMVSTTLQRPDTRFGMQAPLITTYVRTPAGLTATSSQSRVVSQLSGLQITGMTESVIVNGRTYTNTYTAAEGSTVKIETGGKVPDYGFSTAMGLFNSIVGKPGTVSVGDGDDNTYPNIPIGFDVWFGGDYYSQVAICTNGWISFNAGTSSADNGTYLSSATDIYPLVAPLFDDLVVHGSIYYNTAGIAPHRIFTVEWNNVGWNWNNPGNSISFQVIFSEETGAIRFVYTPGADGISNGSAVIGIANAVGFLSVSELTTSAIVSSESENDNIAAEPPDGMAFSFTPPVHQVFLPVPAGTQGVYVNNSPEGRKRFTFINTRGKIVKDSIPGIESTSYSYDPKGRLITLSQGGRTASFTYDTKSFIASATDAIHRISQFEYDSVGRITRQVLPDSHEILYGYDANGNINSLTPPGKPTHNVDYNKVDLADRYIPPISGIDTTATRYEYNKDKQILRVLRPDGGVIETIYDTVGCGGCGGPVGRPKQILFDRGSLNFKYDPSTGLLDSLIAPSDTTVYTYDGSLLVSVTKQNERTQHLNYYFDNNFRITDQELWVVNPDGEDYDLTTEYTYDLDGMLAAINVYDSYWNPVAPTMGINRDPATGRVTDTYLGNLTSVPSYNKFGELSAYLASHSGNPIFQTNYQRDSLGRISELHEIVEGWSERKNYAYDVAGRLWKVWRNDTLTSTYTYDANGNRLFHWTPSKIDSGSYDSQDRLLSCSSTQLLTDSTTYYSFTRNGELSSKVEGTDTTRYTYDYFGNLTRVILPNSDCIDYIIDGQNRRIGKKINGAIVKRWIYSGQLSPNAELDSAGNVIAQFMGSYMIKNGNTYQLITDHLGSIRLVVDVMSGDIAQRIDYDEFGNVLANTNPDFQPFAYVGGLYDQQIGLVRLGARDYEASVGRWQSKEPLGFIGANNFYSYAYNDPINSYDNNGLWPTGRLGLYQVHQSSINRQLSFLPPSDRGILNAQQVAADADQSTAGSYKHGMRDGDANQSVEEAKKAAENYLQNEIKCAKSLEQQGKHEDALKHLGNAMHMLQDMTDPMHAGFQPWDSNIIHQGEHVAGELYDPGEGSALDIATLTAYGYFVGTVPVPQRIIK